MNNETLIGYAPVDSGSVVIGDPCYLIPGGASRTPEWDEIVDLMFDEQGRERPGENGTSAIRAYGTFIAGTPHGDGQYPVYAETDVNGRVTSLRIDLDPRMDDDYDDESENA